MPGPDEAHTRKELIDPALTRAGWDLNNPAQVRFEIPVDGAEPDSVRTLREKLGISQLYFPAGICDYALYAPNGEILAIVEAKRTSIDPRLAEAQAQFYVAEIEKWQNDRPFAFMTNRREQIFL